MAIVDGTKNNKPPYFLLTRRASKMRTHAGQFALPGGKVDIDETTEQAALRELQEELGVTVAADNILGVLDDYPTRSGFCITPVVVWLDHPETITPNPDEVAKVFQVPLDELTNESLLNLVAGETPDSPILSINLPTIGHEIYAPTAAIIYQFYEVAIRQNYIRVASYEEPEFAWK